MAFFPLLLLALLSPAAAARTGLMLGSRRSLLQPTIVAAASASATSQARFCSLPHASCALTRGTHAPRRRWWWALPAASFPRRPLRPPTPPRSSSSRLVVCRATTRRSARRFCRCVARERKGLANRRLSSGPRPRPCARAPCSPCLCLHRALDFRGAAACWGFLWRGPLSDSTLTSASVTPHTQALAGYNLTTMLSLINLTGTLPSLLAPGQTVVVPLGAAPPPAPSVARARARARASITTSSCRVAARAARADCVFGRRLRCDLPRRFPLLGLPQRPPSSACRSPPPATWQPT